MSITHVLFIPVVLILGIVIGYQMGAKAVRADVEKQRARMKE